MYNTSRGRDEESTATSSFFRHADDENQTAELSTGI